MHLEERLKSLDLAISAATAVPITRLVLQLGKSDFQSQAIENLSASTGDVSSDSSSASISLALTPPHLFSSLFSLFLGATFLLTSLDSLDAFFTAFFSFFSSLLVWLWNDVKHTEDLQLVHLEDGELLLWHWHHIKHFALCVHLQEKDTLLLQAQYYKIRVWSFALF